MNQKTSSAQIFSFQEEKDKREINRIISHAKKEISWDKALNALSFNISNIIADSLAGKPVDVCVTLTMFWFINEAFRIIDLYEEGWINMDHTRSYVSQNYW